MIVTGTSKPAAIAPPLPLLPCDEAGVGAGAEGVGKLGVGPEFGVGRVGPAGEGNDGVGRLGDGNAGVGKLGEGAAGVGKNGGVGCFGVGCQSGVGGGVGKGRGEGGGDGGGDGGGGDGGGEGGVPTCTQRKLSVYISSSSSKGVAATGLSTSWLVRGSSRNCCDCVDVQGNIDSTGYLAGITASSSSAPEPWKIRST
jgi:hypothetical protein